MTWENIIKLNYPATVQKLKGILTDLEQGGYQMQEGIDLIAAIKAYLSKIPEEASPEQLGLDPNDPKAQKWFS